MAKPGTPRHSKSARKPVTINLDPEDVKQVTDPASVQATRPAEPVGDFSKKPETAEAAAQKSAEMPKAPAAPFSENTSSEKTSPEKTDRGNTGSAKTGSENISSRPPYPSTSPTHTSTSSTPPARGAGSLFVAGLSGGIIALLGAAALQWGNVIPSPGASVTAAQLAQIEQEIARLNISPPPAPMDDTAKQQLAIVEKTASNAADQAAKALNGLTSLKQSVENLPTASATSSGDLAALTERLDTVESKLASTQSQADQNAAATSNDANTLTDLQSKLSALQDSVAETARQPDAAALIAANSLKTAVDRGGSFVAELDTYAPLAPESSDIDALRPYASKGIPTIADLNAWFGPVADKIVATANKLPADAGLWDHLVASAKGLVNIRPVGDVSGSGVGPSAARMEAALHSGDLERAIGEWEQLPEDAKAVSQEFAGQMKARRDADALVTRLVTDSLKPKAAMPAPVAN